MNVGRIGAGIALLSGALLTTEIVLTRIFSVIVWYHFAFFAISIALLGMGAASLAVHTFQQRLRPERTSELLTWGAASLAATALLADIALINVAPDWFGTGALTGVISLTFRLGALFVIAAAPFFCGGFTLALAILRCAPAVDRIYAWDLVGAGTACALAVPLLDLLSGPLALLAAATMATAAALVFAGNASSRVVAWTTAGGVALAIALGQLANLYEVRSAKGINLVDTPPEYNRWNSFSMVTVLPQVGFSGWGLSPAYRGPVPEQKMLVIDLNAMTTLTRFSGDMREASYIASDLVSFVYQVKPHAERVCVIGAGGGRDVLAALVSGARHVVAVEINPLIVEGVMRGAFRDYVGGLYDRPDVHAVVQDGRGFVRHSNQRWDVVHLSMVDTSAATAAGAYALTENGLYTVDAFEQFLRRLSPGGVLSVSSVSLPELAVGARLVAVARAALERLGADPARSIAVLETPWIQGPHSLFNILVAPTQFDAAMRQRIEQQAARLAFIPTFVPGRTAAKAAFSGVPHPERAWIADIVNAPPGALDAVVDRLPLDVSPPTDNRPFFFYQNRLSDIGRALVAEEPKHPFGNGLVILSKVVVTTTVLVAIFILLPFLPRRRELIAGVGSPICDVGYALCLGVGFMLAEIALVLRFSVYLGNPTATLSVVLFVLLVMGAVGSARLARRADSTRLSVVLAVLIAYLLLLAVGLGPLLHASDALPGVARSLIAAACLAPLGLLFGVPLPSMLRVVGVRAAARIPWLFGINGAASVLGSILGTLLALHAGISATLGAAASLYLGALLLARRVMAA